MWTIVAQIYVDMGKLYNNQNLKIPERNTIFWMVLTS